MAKALDRIVHKEEVLRKKWHHRAKAAMLREPDYFVWWYTFKSLALVGAIGVAAYYAGKSAGGKP
jgi:hypothetical protein